MTIYTSSCSSLTGVNEHPNHLRYRVEINFHKKLVTALNDYTIPQNKTLGFAPQPPQNRAFMRKAYLIRDKRKPNYILIDTNLMNLNLICIC